MTPADVDALAGHPVQAPFHVARLPLPWQFARLVEDGVAVWETATGVRVFRCRTEWVVPAPNVAVWL